MEGYWLVARRQTAGRGRLGRDWSSVAGNFHGSTTVALRPDDPPAATLALVAAIAVHRTVVDLAGGAELSPTIKWPNDVLIGPAKLAGILLERSGDIVIAGIGINIVAAPLVAGRPTTSLAAHGSPAGVEAVAEALAATFADELVRWRATPLARTSDRWQVRAQPIGTPLLATTPSGERIAGVYDGLEAGGALRMRLADGAVYVMHAGEILLADPAVGANART